MIQPVATIEDEKAKRKNPFTFLKKVGQDSILTEPEQEHRKPVLLPKSTNENVEDTRQNYYQSLQNQKVSLNNLLMDDPQRPEIDKDQIERNRKFAKNAAIVAAIDAIASGIGVAKNPETAITTPSKIGELGFTAIDNIRKVQDDHKIELRRFEDKKDETDRFNRQVTQNTNQFNAGIDADIAAHKLDVSVAEQAEAKRQELEESTRERLASDKKAERYYQLAVELASGGDTDGARQLAGLAGLSETETAAITGISERISQASGITPQQATLYNEYVHYANQVSNEDYAQDLSGRPDYSRPIPGSPAWHRDRLTESLGDDFYRIDYEMRQQNEQNRSVQNRTMGNSRSEALSQDPKVQEGIRESNRTMQKMLIHNVLNGKDEQTKERATDEWLKLNTKKLKEEGVPDDQIDQYNEQMFIRMIQEVSGDGNEAEKSLPFIENNQDEMLVEKVRDGSPLNRNEAESLLQSPAFRSKLELEMVRGTGLGREIKDRLVGNLIGYDSRGRRYDSSITDMLKSPVILAGEGLKILNDYLQKQNEKQREEIIQQLMSRYNL